MDLISVGEANVFIEEGSSAPVGASTRSPRPTRPQSSLASVCGRCRLSGSTLRMASRRSEIRLADQLAAEPGGVPSP